MNREWRLNRGSTWPVCRSISRKDRASSIAIFRGEIGFKEDTVPAYQQPLFYSAEQCRSIMWGYRKHFRLLANIAIAKHGGLPTDFDALVCYERCVALSYID